MPAHRLASAAFAATLCCALASPAQAAPEFTGEARLFEITQPNGLRRTVPAVEQAQSASTFYDYWSASSHTGYEQRLRSILFLHRDLTTDELGMIITHGIDDTGQPAAEKQPTGRVRFDMDGVPAGARVTQSDDPNRGGRPELSLDHEPEGDWSYGNNTDGGSIAGLPIDQDWAITITPNFTEGNTSWAYHFADGTLILLDMQTPVTIRSRGQSQAGDTLSTEMCALATLCAFVTDPGAARIDYNFDWGDGGQTPGQSEPGLLFCEDHTFLEAGMFDVVITATNERGESATKTIRATVRGPQGFEDGTCGTGEPGICGRGHFECEGETPVCVTPNEATDELCNGLDDDCDGRIDEELRNACGGCGALPPDVCNGRDDDCDGTIDNGPSGCPAGAECVDGACAGGCVRGECGAGQLCQEGFCLPACEVVACAVGQRCNRGTGACVDPCAGVSCPPGLSCANGLCGEAGSCYILGCPEGERCVDNSCRADACADVSCNPGSFCRDGVCRASCADVSCQAGAVCRGGNCEADACAWVSCEAGESCVAGACQPDPCDPAACGAGRACAGGVCAHDPCANIDCPPNERCERGECVRNPNGEDGAGEIEVWDPNLEPEPSPEPTPQVGITPAPSAGNNGGDNGGNNGGNNGANGNNNGANGDTGSGGSSGCASGGTPALYVGLLLLAVALRRRH